MSRDYKRNWGIGGFKAWGMGHGAWSIGKRVWEYESVGVWECGAGEVAIS